MISEHFSGPLPHPKHLAGYEAVAPGSADRIITMAEKSVAAYISNQQLVLQADVDDRKLGMCLGAACFALLVAGALICYFKTGDAVVTGIFLGAGAIGVIAAFINGRIRDKPMPTPKK